MNKDTQDEKSREFAACMHNAPLEKREICPSCTDKPKIFAFLNGGSRGFYSCVGIAQDGEVLAGHCCSDEYYTPHDLGVTSDWKHDEYRKKYPDGFQVVLVRHSEVAGHVELQEAFRLNKLMADPTPAAKAA